MKPNPVQIQPAPLSPDRVSYLIGQFMRKFRAIPYARWTTHEVQNERGQRCAFGHCLTPKLCRTKQSEAINDLFAHFNLVVTKVNDFSSSLFPHYHPRTRILAALEYMHILTTPPAPPTAPAPPLAPLTLIPNTARTS